MFYGLEKDIGWEGVKVQRIDLKNCWSYVTSPSCALVLKQRMSWENTSSTKD